MTTATTSRKTRVARLHEREPQVIARDAAYVAAALTDDAVTTLTRAKDLRETGPERIKTLPTDAQATLRARREQVESQLAELRERATSTADERYSRFESTFDTKAQAGARRVEQLKHDERVTRYTTPFEPVGDQLKIARSQVKGAVTSIRKTVDAAVEAGRAQADTARSQVKAAATSTRKTVDAVVDAGRDIAS